MRARGESKTIRVFALARRWKLYFSHFNWCEWRAEKCEKAMEKWMDEHVGTR
ncbi:hypothetical protein HMPREF1991_01418 [Hoylesella loescheii DSM 19665 = JCM 12249 = ATCC 15930]|uniref:Uncharacterized protein n=1 Tax=Hoylesella loescheii DSM 19665 = JCM 12249 = ATCC 15930 TaxID=1122985 RepID=A0A069QRR0_HOYLO|nr:hypothetical protein HMPREF1991_01418 [Hoylesella loescheii DSM 19665 = JCM 12249 = ATCC 15930]